MKKDIKKSVKVILVSVIFAAISAIVSYWVFEGGWYFLPFPILTGMFMVFVQNETRSYRFLDRLVVNSLLYGVLTEFFIALQRYLVMCPQYPEYPFIYYFFNLQDAIIFVLVFSFISFMGGLLGIVIKGFYCLFKNRN